MKNLKWKVVSSLTALLTASCITTPGMEEPSAFYCTIISPDEAECRLSDGDYVTNMKIVDLIGYIGVRPKAFSSLMSHHEILHRELNQCLAGKK